MSQWFYLSFGFALLFTFLGKEDAGGLGSREVREIWLNAFRLVVGVGLLTALNSLFTFFVWGPASRNDLGRVSLFLWAFLIDEAMGRLRKEGKGKEKIRIVVSRSFLALVAFSLWMVEKQSLLPPVGRFLWGLGLPLGAGVFEWLLGGLRERVKLSHLPPPLEGAPILFWLAMLLSLALGGFREMAQHL